MGAPKGMPKMVDLDLLIQAGIDPKTGLPRKMAKRKNLKPEIKRALRIIDEQDAVNRYVWYNLPNNITSQELERMLYYKGQLCFFYMKDLDQFFFMPYALDGTIDFYGRYNRVHPVPMTSGTEDKNGKAQAQLLSEIKLDVLYGIPIPKEGDTVETFMKSLENKCVLLYDYSKQLAQTITPRVEVNDAILDVMSECVPFMRTSLLLSTGVKGMRVQNGDDWTNVQDANKSVEDAALSGDPYIPMVGITEFQDLQNGQVAKSEEYMLAMQSLDNLRLSTYGIDNGGLFEKKAHELQTEADINGGPVGLVLQDGLSIRQNFCNIVNALYGLGMWCEPAENITGADMNGDGLMYDRNDDGAQTGTDNTNTNTGGGEDE